MNATIGINEVNGNISVTVKRQMAYSNIPTTEGEVVERVNHIAKVLRAAGYTVIDKTGILED